MSAGDPSRRPKRRTVGLLVDWLKDEYQNTVLSGVLDGCEHHDLNLICFTGGVLRSPASFGAERNVLYDLAGPDNVDGVMVMSGTLGNHVGPDELAGYCERYRPLPMSSIAVALRGIPSLLVDNAKGMRDAIAHLIRDHGYRRIAFVRGPEVNEEAERRYRVYQDVLAESGLALDPTIVTIGDFRGPAGAEAVRVMLDERHATFDAVVAANDYMALGAMEALQARGIRVPGEVAVMGFDDVEDARVATPPLSTVRQPLYDQGRRAVELIVQQISGTPVAPEIMMQTELVLRQSCGCRPTMDLPEADRSAAADEPAEALILARRGAIAGAMAEEVHASGPAPGWAEGLVTAFAQDLASGSRELLAALDAALRAVVATGGDVAAWQHVITALRSGTVPLLTRQAKTLLRAETLLQEARTLIGAVAERAQAQQRLHMERWARTLSETSEALITSFDINALVNAIAEQFPRLQIPGCYLSLYQGDDEPAEWSRLILAYEGDRRADLPGGKTFLSRQLLPREMLPDGRRTSFVVEPLFIRSETQLGFVLFEMGPREGAVYESLREQISGALKGAMLVQRLLEEATRRQKAERERLEKEMEIAARIQTTILPRNLEVPGLHIAATMLPATEVGGDYYDVVPYDGGCWIGIGDVAGHGLKTGLVMLMIQSVVAGLCRQNAKAPPREVLCVLNAVLYDNVRMRMDQYEHATLTLMRCERSGRVTFAGAHEDIILCRADGTPAEVVNTPGTWIGAKRDISEGAVDTEINLRDGDLMVLHTDGVTEAMDGTRRQFGIDRLKREIEQVRNEPVTAVRDHIVEAVRSWMQAQDDDITVLVARFRAPGSHVL